MKVEQKRMDLTSFNKTNQVKKETKKKNYKAYCFFFVRVSTLTLTLKQHSFKKTCFHTIRSVSDCESLQSDIDSLVQWSNE